MNSLEHTDPDGDALTITHENGQVYITCTTAHAEVTVGPLAPGILADHDMDGGVAAALIEKEVDRADALARLEALGDDGTALRCAVMIASVGAGEKTVAEFCRQVARGDDVNVAARAEKAEQERDHWKREADGANEDLAHLRAAESRPLTPDAITGAMAARAMLVLAKHGYRPGHTITHEALIAALTEPPKRPEGAEEIERLLMDADREGGEVYRTDGYTRLADYLAEGLAKGGVRVAPEGGAA